MVDCGMVGVIHERPDQLAIAESFLLKVAFDWNGWNRIFHGTT